MLVFECDAINWHELMESQGPWDSSITGLFDLVVVNIPDINVVVGFAALQKLKHLPSYRKRAYLVEEREFI